MTNSPRNRLFETLRHLTFFGTKRFSRINRSRLLCSNGTPDKIRLSLSVRDLVEFGCRRGDLTYATMQNRDPAEAIRIHQKIQKSRPSGYRSEVTVSREFETPGFVLEVRGRIDGVLETGDGVTVEEIKTTASDLEEIAVDRNPNHWGQLKTYAFFYASEQKLDRLSIQLTYHQIDTNKTREIREDISCAELSLFVDGLVEGYLAWAQRTADWIDERNRSIANLTFPFEPYRPGQRRMAGAVYANVKQGQQALLQAPTGVGKTMAALVPAIAGLGRGSADVIFFLTARTTGKAAAERALDTLRENGLRFKSVTLTAKDKICFNPEKACHPDECEFARGYYDKLTGALHDAFAHDAFTFESISEFARDRTLCPFEFSLDLSLWVDCIIGDYNYAFDPRVSLRRFFKNDRIQKTLIVDEAHNLIDRARDMFSAELSKKATLECRRLLKTIRPPAYRALGQINRCLLDLRQLTNEEGGRRADSEFDPKLASLLRRFVGSLQDLLQKDVPVNLPEPVMEFFFDSVQFLSTIDRYDDHYITLYETSGKEFRVRLFCLNPAREMAQRLAACASVQFMSATLVPMDYFKQVLGCADDARTMELPSPFPPDNLRLFIAPNISTRYRQRRETVEPLCDILASLVGSKTGNYLLFFPSYEYLNLALNLFVQRNPDMKTLVQDRDFSDTQREEFLESFSVDREETLVAFAVMGGVFGEGIDLVGERLSGVAIVGVGLPGLSFERDLIREYFDRTYGVGHAYAYRFPGFNRVLQAAGRLIRSETDRGVVLLIDDRFNQKAYRSLFPKDWTPTLIFNNNTLRKELELFWNHEAKTQSA